MIVLCQTLSFTTSKLEYAEVQTPLVESDLFFGAANKSSVRFESEYCLFKPKCDVIVNATAYAPRNQPVTKFEAGFAIRQPEPDSVQKTLLEKSVRVLGERRFVKRNWLVRAMFGMLKYATLTAVSVPPWKLTKAASFAPLSLRYEQALGGHVGFEDDALAGFTFDANPIGCGLMKSKTLQYLGIRSVPAPRIERSDFALTSKMFCAWQKEQTPLKYEVAFFDAACSPTGFCIRPKTHPSRAALLGTVDDAFIQSDAPLPADFAFAYFNAAPADQQVERLGNDEVVELRNLCPHDTPGLALDGEGNATLSLSLPRHECFALLRLANGAMCTEPLLLDTMVIEPDTHTVSLVWRIAILKDADAAIRVCEVRMRTHVERNRLQAMQTALAAQRNDGDVDSPSEATVS